MGLEGTAPLFFFGFLRDWALREVVLGRDHDARAVTVPGKRAVTASAGGAPYLLATPGTNTNGLLLENPTSDDRARIDHFERALGNAPSALTVRTNGASQTVTMYLPRETPPDSAAKDWSFSDWQSAQGPLERQSAVEIMRMFGQFTPDEVRARASVIRTRAQAFLNAQNFAPPSNLRSGFSRDDVTVTSQEITYSNFFSFEEIELQHRMHSGDQSGRMLRGVTMTADAVSVLPYDPKRDRVLLIEQFRAAALLRGDPNPWGLEVVAGRVDPGEMPQETARREALEEAGIELSTLHQIGSYYSSPGSNTEYLYSFVAECDLPDLGERMGGLETEMEDIRSMIVPFRDLEAALVSGEVDNGPLLISTLWLQRARAAIWGITDTKIG